MDNKSLKNKAIEIKGKKYVLVSDRIIFFNENYPNGSIRTVVSEVEGRVNCRAEVFPDMDKPERFFTGHSQAVWGDGYINKTSALENSETSAVGRALALMGIGVIDSIASVDEINKTQNQTKTPPKPAVIDYTGGKPKLIDQLPPQRPKMKPYEANKVTSNPEKDIEIARAMGLSEEQLAEVGIDKSDL